MKKFTILLVSLLVLGACQTVNNIKEQAVNCNYTLAGAETTDFSLSSISMDVGIGIQNNSKTTAAKMNRFEGKLYLNNSEVSDVKLNSYEVAPSTAQVVVAHLTIPFSKIGKNIAGLVVANSQSLDYKVIGKMYFDTPIGELPIPVVIEPPAKK